MRFYFSGIGKPPKRGQLSAEFLLLREAGVRYILVDQLRLPHIGDFREGVMLDSAAYYAHKHLVSLSLTGYLDIAATQGPFDMMAALDVVMNPKHSHAYWQAAKRIGVPTGMFPVWQWNGPPEYLREYLDESEIVGIGGLVELMRNKDEAMLRELISLCTSNPNRLHIFSCSWLRCFKDLRDIAYSADSSKWLDPARRNTIIFPNTRNGHLSQIPMSEALEQSIIETSLGREERLVLSARNMDVYCNRQ